MASGDRGSARAAVVAGLAAGLTKTEVARQTNVSHTTINRWLKQEEFRQWVEDARAELVSRTIGRLVDATTGAVATLVELLGPGTPPAVRLGAARTILEMAVRYRESEELEKRLAALEAAVAAREHER